MSKIRSGALFEVATAIARKYELPVSEVLGILVEQLKIHQDMATLPPVRKRRGKPVIRKGRELQPV